MTRIIGPPARAGFRAFLSILAALVFLSSSATPAAGQSIGELGADEVALARTLDKQGDVVWRSAAISQDFTGVVVRGKSSNRSLTGKVRFDGGAWHDLFIVFSATSDVFMAGYHGEAVYPGGSYEIRFDTPVELSGSGTFDNREDADRQLGDDAQRPAAPGKHDGRTGARSGGASGVIIAPRVHYRSEWGAEPFIGTPVALARPDYIYLTFHHAAGFGAFTYDEGLEQLRAIQRLHQNVRGWSDIGYHFVMDQSGRIYQGRPFLNGNISIESAPALALGAHAGGHNTGNIGLCVLGCYHPPAGSECEDVLSETALDSLAVMFAFLSETYAVPPENLRGHRDFGDTACPGNTNYVLLDDLRQRIHTLLITGNAPIGAAQLAAVTDEAGVVHLSWTFLDGEEIDRYRIVRAVGSETTLIFEGDGTEAASIVDDAAITTGAVVYRLYATSSAGREQLLAAVEAHVGNPEQFILTENFPNPFSRATTIRYFLPQEGFVRLAVYDLLGREVDVLVDGHQDGGQWYYAELDASGLPAGTYFYRLEVEGFAGTIFKESRSLIRVR